MWRKSLGILPLYGLPETNGVDGSEEDDVTYLERVKRMSLEEEEGERMSLEEEER